MKVSEVRVQTIEQLEQQDFVPRDMAALSRRLYRDETRLTRLKQQFRPYICPFHRLVTFVSEKSTLLDIGCGSGIFIGLLASLDKLSSGKGFDSNAAAIQAANAMHLPDAQKGKISFELRDAKQGMPNGEYSVVSLIDVIHHVPVHAQEHVVEEALQHVAPGGHFIYKDMVARPVWRAWANRVHDVVLAGDWIHYFDISKVESIAIGHGFELVDSGGMNMLWYGHEWRVFRRPAYDAHKADN